MAFSKKKYINSYNKENYKIYQFRVKKSDKELIDFLDSVDNRNKLINDLVKENASKNKILTINEITSAIKPICKKYGVNKAWLFGSYSRNEARGDSDVDLLFDTLNTSLPWGGSGIFVEIEEALGKKCDIVFENHIKDEKFKNEISKDLIYLF